MSKIEIEAVKYMIIGAAVDDRGAINEVFQFAFPRDGDSSFRSRTDNVNLLRTLLTGALEALDYAEADYKKRASAMQ